MSVLIFYATIVEKFLILRKIQRDIIINVHRFYVKYSLFLSGINQIWIFSTDFRKKQTLNTKCHKNSFSGIHVVSCGTNGQTHGYMTKVTTVFQNFANAPEHHLGTNTLVQMAPKFYYDVFQSCRTITTEFTFTQGFHGGNTLNNSPNWDYSRNGNILG
jgi:hypothetical protein